MKKTIVGISLLLLSGCSITNNQIGISSEKLNFHRSVAEKGIYFYEKDLFNIYIVPNSELIYNNELTDNGKNILTGFINYYNDVGFSNLRIISHTSKVTPSPMITSASNSELIRLYIKNRFNIDIDVINKGNSSPLYNDNNYNEIIKNERFELVFFKGKNL